MFVFNDTATNAIYTYRHTLSLHDALPIFPAKTEIGVTTGPIRGSRKVHVPARTGSGIRVAMREIDLEPGCGEPPLRVYDTSGPYTDPAASIDIMAGLPALRRPWIEARGEVESYDARQSRPEDNGQDRQSTSLNSSH